MDDTLQIPSDPTDTHTGSGSEFADPGPTGASADLDPRVGDLACDPTDTHTGSGSQFADPRHTMADDSELPAGRGLGEADAVSRVLSRVPDRRLILGPVASRGGVVFGCTLAGQGARAWRNTGDRSPVGGSHGIR